MHVSSSVELLTETDEQARSRDARRELAIARPHAMLELPFPNGNVVVPITSDEHVALTRDPLFIAFYNMSGRLPDRTWDFSGLDGITEDERRQIPRYHGVRAPSGTRMHYYLTDGKPLQIDTRVAVVPILSEKGLWRVRLQWDKSSWITHFAIGSRERGVIVAAQFDHPMAVLPGNNFKFSLRPEDLFRSPELVALPSTQSQPLLQEATRHELGPGRRKSQRRISRSRQGARRKKRR